MHTGYGGGDIWYVTDKMSVGDLVLSVVATAPRMIIGLEEVEVAYDLKTSSKMECVESTRIFSWQEGEERLHRRVVAAYPDTAHRSA
jgi:predicted Mrr-cat superfamily restriction endonuclease